MLLTCLNDIAINMNYKDIVSYWTIQSVDGIGLWMNCLRISSRPFVITLQSGILLSIKPSMKIFTFSTFFRSDGMVLNSIEYVPLYTYMIVSSEEYQTSLKLIHTYEQQKLYMDAIRLCVSIKNRVPDEYSLPILLHSLGPESRLFLIFWPLSWSISLLLSCLNRILLATMCSLTLSTLIWSTTGLWLSWNFKYFTPSFLYQIDHLSYGVWVCHPDLQALLLLGEPL